MRRFSKKGEIFQVSVSMLEIYDEKVLDLLSGGKEPLPIREDQSGSVFVSFDLTLKDKKEIVKLTGFSRNIGFVQKLYFL